MNSVAHPGLAEAFRVWLRIGLLSFGGPAAQIALMHRILVDERRWIDEPRFLHALNFCMLLPGPEAQQLATYVGWSLHGVRGGLVAGLLFILPGALAVLALSMAYVSFGHMPWLAATLLGLQAAVLVIVLEALLRVARRALKDGFAWTLAGLAFVALFVFALPFPLVVLAAGCVGALRAMGARTPHEPTGVVDVPDRARMRSSVRAAVICALLWLSGVVAVHAMLGYDATLSRIARLFSELAVVTFGGAYAVLAYLAQRAVEDWSWLSAAQMLDGLGLAETTPGPLILVTQFVGYVAGHSQPDFASPTLSALAGAAVTTTVTFLPCFVWIFAGAPWVERLRHIVWLRAALAAITAAVVGVILNLALWFALHVLFAEQRPAFAALHLPVLASLREGALGLSILAGLLMFGLHFGIARTLAVCCALALLAVQTG